MRDGELLLEVNDESVESLKHEEVVDRVKLSGREVRLTTITPKGLEFYTQVAITYHIRALLFQLIQVYIEGGWCTHLEATPDTGILLRLSFVFSPAAGSVSASFL